jgi:hypothetical protein
MNAILISEIPHSWVTQVNLEFAAMLSTLALRTSEATRQQRHVSAARSSSAVTGDEGSNADNIKKFINKKETQSLTVEDFIWERDVFIRT